MPLREGGRAPSTHTPSDVSGKAPEYGNACGLEEVVAAFDELLLLPDHGAVYVTLAGVIANYAEGDVVWPLLVGPSGCGKSELITAVTSVPGVWSLSSLTPQTLLSGFERKGEPASLLKQIGEFGILAFKDLTTVLTMHREARSQIIGQLREVADGKTEKSFGNGLRLEWEGKLGFIAGVTPVIDEQHVFISVMGERFLLYRMPEVPRAVIARRSLARRGHEPELRQRIRATVGDFLEQFQGCGVLTLPDSLTEHLIVLADMVTRARSGVPRDYNGNLSFIPEPEAPTRLAKQLAQLGAALLAIGVDEAETWRLIRKAGWDSVPAVRCTVLDCLSRQSDPVQLSTIQEETDLPDRTVARVVEDVVVLGLAKRVKQSGKWIVEQSAITRAYWKDERLPETSEGLHDGHLPRLGEDGFALQRAAVAFSSEPELSAISADPPDGDVDMDEVARLAELASRYQDPRLCHCSKPLQQVDEDNTRRCVTCGKPLDPPRTVEQVAAEEEAQRDRDRQFAAEENA